VVLYTDQEDRRCRGRVIPRSKFCGRSGRQKPEKAVEICRKLGVSEQTFYTWKRKYSGIGLSELRELRQLRDENGKLKKLVADLSLDRHMLQEIVRKKL
jgi:putative transposase